MGRPILLHALTWADDPRPRMREMVCFLLGLIGEREEVSDRILYHYPEGSPVLLRLLDTDPNDDVRVSAMAALGRHAVPSTVTALARLASHPSEDVRLELAMALGSFYGDNWSAKDQPYREAAAATFLELMDDLDKDVRDWATFGLHQGGHDTPKTRARLWKALDDPHPDVRGEAAEGLALFGDRSLIPRMDTLLREDPDLPSHFFTAAEELGDPILLPAVELGAARWREMGAQVHYSVTSALEALSGKSISRESE